MLQSLAGLPRSLLQGLLLSLLLAPLHPPACQSPLQGVPAPQPVESQAWLPNWLPTQRSPQWTTPHPPMIFPGAPPHCRGLEQEASTPSHALTPTADQPALVNTTQASLVTQACYRSGFTALVPSGTATQCCAGSLGQNSCKCSRLFRAAQVLLPELHSPPKKQGHCYSFRISISEGSESFM